MKGFLVLCFSSLVHSLPDSASSLHLHDEVRVQKEVEPQSIRVQKSIPREDQEDWRKYLAPPYMPNESRRDHGRSLYSQIIRERDASRIFDEGPWNPVSNALSPVVPKEDDFRVKKETKISDVPIIFQALSSPSSVKLQESAAPAHGGVEALNGLDSLLSPPAHPLPVQGSHIARPPQPRPASRQAPRDPTFSAAQLNYALVRPKKILTTSIFKPKHQEGKQIKQKQNLQHRQQPHSKFPNAQSGPPQGLRLQRQVLPPNKKSQDAHKQPTFTVGDKGVPAKLVELHRSKESPPSLPALRKPQKVLNDKSFVRKAIGPARSPPRRREEVYSRAGLRTLNTIQASQIKKLPNF